MGFPESWPTYYYVVTSVDSDGDESVRTLKIGATVNTAGVDSMRFIGNGCFIDSTGNCSRWRMNWLPGWLWLK